MTTECRCEAECQRTFESVEDSVCRWMDMKELIEGADLVAHDAGHYTEVYRCRACGMLWAAATRSSGHMDIKHMFPVPKTDDPVRWMKEECEPLMFRRRW